MIDAATIQSSITAISTSITAIGGAVTVIAVLIPTLRVGRSTHTIVNQQRTDAATYREDLKTTLKEHGIEPPADKNPQ